MSTTFPTTKQTLPNPTATDLLENANPELDHDYQHSTINDTVEALQDKVGMTGSAVTTSHDYKLGEVTGSDKAVGKTATQTLSNKTLTAPQINMGSDATGDMYYRNGSGVTTRLPAGAEGSIISYSGGIPTTIPNPAAADASTTVKGVLEIATVAERQAKTATGATGAKLAVTTENLGAWNQAGYAADAEASDTYVITLSPAPSSYFEGMTVQFKANTANTGACTINVNGLGAKSIKKSVSADLATGDILANQIVNLIYDGTNFQISSAFGSTVSTGQATRASGAGTGSQSIAHGLGVVPKMIKITAMGSYAPSGVFYYFSTGTATGTSAQNCTWNSPQTSGYLAGSQDSSNIIHFEDSSSTRVIGNLTTLDATNITINFSTFANTRCDIQWEAFA